MALKYFKRADIYKNSTGTNKVRGDLKAAWSYDWWQYLKEFNGVLVFNNYAYSMSTNKHQYDTQRLLDYKGYIIIETRKSLNDPPINLDWIESHLTDKLNVLLGKKKRARKKEYKQLYRDQIKGVAQNIRIIRGAK